MLSGHVSLGKLVEPGDVAWNVPKARKLRTPGTAIGLSSRFSRTFGCPMR
jgi:hypothetical protein